MCSVCKALYTIHRLSLICRFCQSCSYVWPYATLHNSRPKTEAKTSTLESLNCVPFPSFYTQHTYTHTHTHHRHETLPGPHDVNIVSWVGGNGRGEGWEKDSFSGLKQKSKVTTSLLAMKARTHTHTHTHTHIHACVCFLCLQKILFSIFIGL